MKPHRTDGIDPAARSRARRRALQALYAWQMSNSAIEKVVVYRDEITYHVRREHLVEFVTALRDEPVRRGASDRFSVSGQARSTWLSA